MAEEAPKPPLEAGVYFNVPGVVVVRWDSESDAAHFEWQG